jgi:hypothetical protein
MPRGRFGSQRRTKPEEGSEIQEWVTPPEEPCISAAEEDLEVEDRRHGSLGNQVSDAETNGKEGALGDESSGAARRGQTPEQQRSRVPSRMGRDGTSRGMKPPVGKSLSSREQPGGSRCEGALKRKQPRESSQCSHEHWWTLGRMSRDWVPETRRQRDADDESDSTQTWSQPSGSLTQSRGGRKVDRATTLLVV